MGTTVQCRQSVSTPTLTYFSVYLAEKYDLIEITFFHVNFFFISGGSGVVRDFPARLIQKMPGVGLEPTRVSTSELKSDPLDQLGQPSEMLSTGLEPVTFGS